MEFDEICLLAYKSTPLPRCSGIWEEAAYLALRNLYQEYFHKTITKEQAAEEKDLLKRKFEKANIMEQEQLKLFQYVNSIRIQLAKVRPTLDSHNCKACQLILTILDGI